MCRLIVQTKVYYIVKKSLILPAKDQRFTLVMFMKDKMETELSSLKIMKEE